MKTIFLLLASFCISVMLQAQVSKTVEVTAGNLKTTLSADELNTVTNLTLTGRIDARDFKVLRDTLPNLKVLDLTDINIVAYNGNEGPSGYYSYYQAKTIPANSFYNPNTDKGKNSLTTLILPSSITTIEYYAFQKCNGLTSVTIPSLVSIIGSGAFLSCNNLISVNIPASVTSIGSSAFSCSGLISVDGANPNYSSLDGALFDKNRTGLLQCPTSKTGSYTIPSTVTFIGYDAFSNCNNLTSITIPFSVTSISTGVFNNCSGSISVDEGNPYYSSVDGVLFDKGMYRLIKCPVSKTESYVIPEKVSAIGEQAFYNCSLLSSVTIPTSVTSIGNDAFVNCTGLTTINANSSYPVVLGPYTYVFGLVNQTTCTLQVPYGAKKFYALADQWKDFQNIVEQPNGFILSSNILKLSSDEGSSASVNLTANVAWTARSDQNWLAVNPTSGTGTNTLTFTATANTSLATRTAKVTVSATGFPSQTISVNQSGVVKAIDIEAGALLSGLNTDELSQITRLTITGTMDARDFKIMRDQMPSLAEIDLSGVTIAAYSGTEGTYYTSDYPANSIPDYAFHYYNSYPPKSNLTSVILPPAITAIGNYAFYYCSGLTSIILPPSVTSIGYSAFYSCTGLTSIVVESSYPVDLSSSWSVFQGIDTNKCILNVPYGSKDLYKAAYPWNNFTNIVENSQGFILSPTLIKVAAEGGNDLTANVSANVSWTANSDQTWLTVNPSSGTGNKTLTFTAEANTTVVTRTTKVTISAPDITSQSITISQQGIPKTVNVEAGGLLTGLTSAELNGITNLTITGTIDARDFRIMRDNMPLLAVLDLSASTVVKYSGTEGTSYQTEYPANTLPDYSFYNQNTGKAKIRLTSVVLPSSLTSVGNMSFYGCLALTSVTIPSSLISIGNMSFSDCSGLTSINIPSSVSFIGSNAFNGCIRFTSFDIPSSLTSIESGILSRCAGLTELAIPTSVNSIGIYAFQGCTGLTSVSIPSSVKSIGESAFSFCGKLTAIDIPNSVSRIEKNTFSGCNEMTSVSIPESVTSIADYAFSSCSSLTSITIPASVTFLGEGAFSYCSGLTSVTIPESVNSIGRTTFLNCNGLTTINSNSSHPVNLTASPEVFSGINKATCTLHVPYKSKQLYAAADQWKDFTNIQEKSEGFLFDSSVLRFSAQGGDILVNAKANVLWTASSDQAWLTVNPGSEIGIREITFTAEANQTYATRKAKVTISAPGILSQSISITQEGLPKVIELTAGNLLAGLTAEELLGITNLTITGTIDARDFKTMRDKMPLLALLDLSGTSITAYSGIEGTAGYENNYPANEIPIHAFLNPNTYTLKTTLTSVILPTSVISIGYYAFYNCIGLTSILIPSSVNSISGGAFNNCSGLKSIFVGSGIPVDLSNSWDVFYGIDKNICKLYVPYQSKERYVAAYQWQDFINMVEPNQGFQLNTTKLNISASAGSNTTVTIASNVSWTASSDQTWITINPASGAGDQILTFTAEANPVQTIRKAQVTFSATGFPSQTITVSQEASTEPIIATAGNLKTMFTAEQLGQITKLKLTGTIDARDFKTMRDDMLLLSEIDLGGVVIAEYIGTEGTWWIDSNIITYPENEIPGYAFQNEKSGKTTLTSVLLPKNATSIGYNAFNGAINLTSILIPPTIIKIIDVAFAGCPFTTVTIPASVNWIGVMAFSGSNYINVEHDNPNYCSIDGVLFNKTKTILMQCPPSKNGTYTILPSVTKIDDHAFEYCRQLAALNIPSSVTSISHFAFLDCDSLNSFTIPSSVNYLGDWAFSGCSVLSSLYSRTLVPVDLSKSKEVFLNVNKTSCTLYVPFGTKELYAAANLWKDFQNIVEAPFIELSATKISLAALQGSKADVKIVSDVAWKASSDQSWLTLNPITGTDKQTLVLTADANTSHLDRKAIVTVSATGIDSQTIFVTQAASPVEVTAGNLKTQLTAEELATTTKLTLTGAIDARDFKTMRDDMPNLTEIDLSGTVVLAYTGTKGTSKYSYSITYKANAIPEYAYFIDQAGFGRDHLISFIFPSSVTSIDNSAFTRTGLISVNIPSRVTSIGEGAFDNCNNLTTVIIPSSVISIGYMAFADCRNLTSITIPSSVNSIGFFAFGRGVSNINVDENNPKYSSIDGVLFNKDQTTLIEFPTTRTGKYIIPSTVRTIGQLAFEECYNLSSVTIPFSVTTIESSAFRFCDGLTSITIPSSVTFIGNVALSCSNLQSIHVNSSTPINFTSSPYVFADVNKVSCILYVPFGTKTLYAAANQWKDFTNIVETANGLNVSSNNVKIEPAGGSTATIDLKANVAWTASSNQNWLAVNPESGSNNSKLTFTAEAYTSIGTRQAIVTVSATSADAQQTIIVSQCSNTPIKVTPGGLATALSSEELSTMTRLTITGTIDARDFKTMRDDMPMLAEIDLSGATIAAYNGTGGTSIEGRTSYETNVIPEFAFVGNNYLGKISLTNIVFPKSITTIARFAFCECFGLTSVNLPPSVKILEQNVFTGCGNLNSIIIPEGVETIGNQAFYRCSCTFPIFIPASVTTIEGAAFTLWRGLINVDEKNPNYSSSEGVLFNKSKTELIVFPGTKTGDYVIPSTVKNIFPAAFSDCIGLTSVLIPSSVTSIQNDAFDHCTGLTSVTIPNSVASIDASAFNLCTGLTSVTIPNSVTSIGYGTFGGCTGLTAVTIPNSVTSIGEYAFIDCTGLTSITIPSSVNYIERDAFNGCTGLTSISCNEITPPNLGLSYANMQCNELLFCNVDKTACFLIVPYGSRGKYASANYWQEFKNIVEKPFIELSTTEISLATSKERKADVKIVSDVTWTASSNQRWLTLNPNTGTDEQTLILTAEANPSHIDRKAIVTVSATGIDSQMINVTQTASPVEVTAGNLKAQLTAEELGLATKLTLTGTIDARDFKTMRDDMPVLAEIDLSEAKIAAYSGTDGTWWDSTILTYYPANEIPSDAFNDGTGGKMSLISFIFPKSVTSIGGNAFNSCANLILILSSTIKDIGGSAFSGCFFPSVSIPSSVMSIGTGAFGNANYINVDVNNPNYSSIDGVLFNKLKFSLIQCPFLIQGSYIIPSSVKVIEEFAFYWRQNMTSISIPSSVISISNYAISYCGSLKSIYNYANLPVDLSYSYNVFEGTDKATCTLYVPYGSKSLYVSANQWKDFTNIVEMSGFMLSELIASVKSKQGSTVEISISSNATWSVSSDQSWLTVDTTSGTGNKTLTFTAEGNPVNAMRTATVSVSADGVDSQTITVTQEAWPTDVNDLAENSFLVKCYPNPFNDEIAIEIQNPKCTAITVDIYNLAGERIKNLTTKRKDEKFDLKWNGTNDLGQRVVSGVYICKVNNLSKQMILQH